MCVHTYSSVYLAYEKCYQKSIENFELIKNRLDVVNDYDNDIELKELSNNSLRYYFIDYLLGDCYYRYNDDINNRIEILLKSKVRIHVYRYSYMLIALDRNYILVI